MVCYDMRNDYLESWILRVQHFFFEKITFKAVEIKSLAMQ